MQTINGASISVDPPTVDTAHHLSVSQAAVQIGMSEAGVRKAITDGRLPAVRRGGRFLLHPSAVASYAATAKPRGMHGNISFRAGTSVGIVLNVRHDGVEHRDHALSGAGLVVARIAKWTRICVRVLIKGEGEPDAIRFYELAPAPGETEIRFGGLHVSGRYAIVRELRNSAEAIAAWKGERVATP